MADEEKKEDFSEWEETIKEYVSQYVAEAKENIVKLENELLQLEEGDQSKERIHSIFRLWHTIKGGAGFLGFEKTVELCHKAETIFAKARDKGLEITPSILDVVFEALDVLKNLTENIALNGEEGNVDISNIIKKLENAAEQLEAGAKREEVEEEEEKKEEEKKVEEKEEEKRKEEVRVEQQQPAAAEPAKPPEQVEPEPEKKKREEEKKIKVEETIRVSTRKIEEVLELTEELVLERNFLVNLYSQLEHKYARDEEFLLLGEVISNIDKVVSMVRFSVMKIRMVPLRTLFNEFPAMVRQTARALGKKVKFHIEGEETEIDRRIVDELREPLIHMIRNAIDHGIEPPEERVAKGKPEFGTINLRAYYEGDNVVIEVEDDGRGIDPNVIKRKAIEKGFITPEQAENMTEKEIINLIFLPGFSSKDEATDLSGRGVGMDVVKNKVLELKGTLDIETEVGFGTKIIMKFPLTVGIMTTLRVSCNGKQYFIPLSSVIEITRIESDKIKLARGQKVVFWRDIMVPVIYLSSAFGEEDSKRDIYHLVILGIAERKLGILVDNVIASEEIAVKTFAEMKVPGIAGATISATGEPILVIDPQSLIGLLETGMV